MAKRTKSMEEMAKEGDPMAQNFLGASLIAGEESPPDFIGGFFWYCRAIEKGLNHAKWNAGTMLIEGEGGVPKLESLGIRLIEEAAECNHNSACLFLAHCYREGLFGKKANTELEQYYEEKAWDYENYKEFSSPINVEKEGEIEFLEKGDRLFLNRGRSTLSD